MRIAILNSWPNLEYSAEREFIARFKRACADLGWTCFEVVTSDDILAANVDCVIATHEFSPKLTDVPTIGLLWNPPVFFRDDPLRVRAVLSYDGYLPGSNFVRTYLEDLIFSTEKKSPIADWDFLPTAPATVFRPPDLIAPSIFYAGVHWDGNRHGKLIKKLCASLPMAFYGDPTKWARFGSAYKGKIPFDGATIFDRIHDAGVALCLHRDEHLNQNVPSMRLFESAAAGAVIITENSKFAQENFGDSVLYVERSADEREKFNQINDHFQWVRAFPDEALKKAERSNAIFNKRFALQTLLEKLPEFVQQISTLNHFVFETQCKRTSKVECIVRVGGRDLIYIERCLDSLAAQVYRNIGLILVNYRYVAGLDTLLSKYENRFTSIKQISSKDTGFRSTALWDGMRALDSDYFCNLDDDDTIHINHVGSLVEILELNGDINVAYSGSIQVEDEVDNYFHQSNFDGPIGTEIKENRRILFFEQFDRKRFLSNNFILSNSFLARVLLLTDKDLTDPKLVVAEDFYLYLLFLRRGDFMFSWRATANWHWRTTSEDNSMLRETRHPECHDRVQLRTRFFACVQEPLTTDDVLRPFVTRAWKKYPFIKGIFQSIRKFWRSTTSVGRH